MPTSKSRRKSWPSWRRNRMRLMSQATVIAILIASFSHSVAEAKPKSRSEVLKDHGFSVDGTIEMAGSIEHEGKMFEFSEPTEQRRFVISIVPWKKNDKLRRGNRGVALVLNRQPICKGWDTPRDQLEDGEKQIVAAIGSKGTHRPIHDRKSESIIVLVGCLPVVE